MVPGLKTSEFWITAVLLAAVLAGVVADPVSVAGAALAVLGYQISRSGVKRADMQRAQASAAMIPPIEPDPPPPPPDARAGTEPIKSQV